VSYCVSTMQRMAIRSMKYEIIAIDFVTKYLILSRNIQIVWRILDIMRLTMF
jgi:hypothetical protein